MDASTIGLLTGGMAFGLAGTAIWYAISGIGEVFDLVTGNKEFGA